MAQFIQEIANRQRTLQVDIQPKRFSRFCVEYDVTSRKRVRKLYFNPLDASDKKYSGVTFCGTCHYLFLYFDTVTFNVSSK